MADDAKTWVALATSGLALAGTIISAIVSYRSQIKQAASKAETDSELERLKSKLLIEHDERSERLQAEKVISKFRDPLMHAAYDLQSRIYNILKQDFLSYYRSGSDREKNYAVENTVFLLAQFLGWTELIRLEVQFLGLSTNELTRQFRTLQDNLYTILQSDKKSLGTRFRLFAGEQRAVGELMIDRTSGEPRCLGFAQFLKSRDPAIDYWLDSLRQDVTQMASDTAPYAARLIEIQHSLIDLLEFLDPKFLRFPRQSRAKL